MNDQVHIQTKTRPSTPQKTSSLPWRERDRERGRRLRSCSPFTLTLFLSHQGRGNAGPKVLPERPIQAGTSRPLLLLLLVSILLIGCHEAAPPPNAPYHTASPHAPTPYAGPVTRAIKALSDARGRGLPG